jgi:peroxiredoxin
MKVLSLVLVVLATSLLSASAYAALKVGESAPDFQRADLDGKQLALSSYRGRVVLLNFWATWCEPCRDEMPVFSSWQSKLQAKGLRVVGISMDDDAGQVKKFLKQYPVSYPIAMGDAALAKQLGGVLGLPLSYLIDAQGKVVARYQGEVDLPTLQMKIESLLPKAPRK